MDQFAVYSRLRRAWKRDPVKYMRERLGINPTWQQSELLNALAPEGAKVTCRAGHGIGKTSALAGAILWFLETRRHSKIPCTASTSSQLRDILWAELDKLMRRSDELWEQNLGAHPALKISSMFSLVSERLFEAGRDAKSWFAVARTSSKDRPDALQGFHASDLSVASDGRSLVGGGEGLDGKILFVIDEASGVYDKVFEVAEGALTSPGARLIMIGNPTRVTGYFAESHKNHRAHFTALHFRSQDSPLVSPEYRQKLVDKWGEGSAVVRVRADGEFPEEEADVLISLAETEPCLMRDPYEREDGLEIKVCADVARYGDDRSVVTVVQGRNTLSINAYRKMDTMKFAGIVKGVWSKHNRVSGAICRCYVDVIGVGAGVVDRLDELGVPVISVDVSRSPPKRAFGEELEPATMRDWLWLQAKRHMSKYLPSICVENKTAAEQLVAELAGVKYSIDSDGRLRVESKDQMKKRLGFSPDLADSWINQFHPGPTSGPRVASRGRRGST